MAMTKQILYEGKWSKTEDDVGAVWENFRNLFYQKKLSSSK
jgi:hypothetical protein